MLGIEPLILSKELFYVPFVLVICVTNTPTCSAAKFIKPVLKSNQIFYFKIYEFLFGTSCMESTTSKNLLHNFSIRHHTLHQNIILS